MKIAVNIKALSTRHSFTGEEITYFLEVELLGHTLRIPVSTDVVEDIDVYVQKATSGNLMATDTHYEERREYPDTYEAGIDYDLGAVSLRDMEDL